MKALVQPDGRVAQVVGDNATFPVHEGLIWVDCDTNVRADKFTYDFSDQAFAEIVVPVLTYEEARRAQYGHIGDQLDMQYWDLVNGTSIWQDHIAAVKAAHPKPV